MEAALRNYRAQVDALLAGDGADVDWDDALARHLRWVGFFQHERLVHLLVTLAFGLFALMAGLSVAAARPGDPLLGWGGLGLCALLLGLLVPYIRHYFRLENGVQALYAQTDRLADRARAAAGRT